MGKPIILNFINFLDKFHEEFSQCEVARLETDRNNIMKRSAQATTRREFIKTLRSPRRFGSDVVFTSSFSLNVGWSSVSRSRTWHSRFQGLIATTRPRLQVDGCMNPWGRRDMTVLTLTEGSAWAQEFGDGTVVLRRGFGDHPAPRGTLGEQAIEAALSGFTEEDKSRESGWRRLSLAFYLASSPVRRWESLLEMFNKWQAQRWWAENHEKVMELYSLTRFNRQAIPLPIAPHLEDESLKIESAQFSPMVHQLQKQKVPFHFPKPMSSVNTCGMVCLQEFDWITCRPSVITTTNISVLLGSVAMIQGAWLQHQRSPVLMEQRWRSHQWLHQEEEARFKARLLGGICSISKLHK
ncbi:hypothetical protein HPP92_005403 [Vanilla planifolia]|uniref:BRX domain-containing protein n=1 Tax=Vanilla planifolia TaxID=51239 RepID=A0A835VBB7_VANPL|nr:hypothetical protein HPP92_005403 [Vanilla planifolia]